MHVLPRERKQVLLSRLKFERDNLDSQHPKLKGVHHQVLININTGLSHNHLYLIRSVTG